MMIYDKASWHIDAGEPSGPVVEKFRSVMSFLHDNHLLSADGEELFELGVDRSISLHDKMVNSQGKEFLDSHYDSIIDLPSENTRSALEVLFSQKAVSSDQK